MTPTLRRIAVAVVAALLSATALTAVAAGATARTATTPPWEPDPNSVGGLLFYNSSGHQVTGGNLSDTPIAAYVQGTKAIRTGDTKATLYGYLPVKGQAPGAWSGELLGGPSVYPNTAAPAPLGSSSLPLYTGAGTDLNLADLAADFPNTDTSSDGYAGLYELRLATTQAGKPSNTDYDSADVMISGSTWSVAYSNLPKQATTTKLAVSPASPAYHGAKVTLSATVSPTAAAGDVTFRDGSTVLKTVAVSAGKASFSTTALADGTHSLKASFVPTSGQPYAGSSSSTVSFTVRAHPTTTTLTLTPASSAYHGTTVKFAAVVSPSTAAGSIRFYNGSTVLKTVTVSGGKAGYSTTALTDAVHKLKATFVPSSTAAYSGSSSSVHSFTVKPRPTTVKLKASATSVAKGKRLTLTATETPSTTGTVTFFNGSSKLAKVSVSGGRASYSTTALTVGKHTIKATFTPSSTSNYKGATSASITVTIRT